MSNAEVTSTLEIGCNCRAVRVELTGALVAQVYCHCGDCQAVRGAGYVAAQVECP
jgi:hypothetical protein